MKTDKDEISKIMEEIEKSLIRAAERKYWKLSADERAWLPESLRVRFEPSAG
jgi:hypothetical protein